MRRPGTEVPISDRSTLNVFLLFRFIVFIIFASLLCTSISRPALGGKGPLRGPMGHGFKPHANTDKKKKKKKKS